MVKPVGRDVRLVEMFVEVLIGVVVRELVVVHLVRVIAVLHIS